MIVALACLSAGCAQKLVISSEIKGNGICPSMNCNSLDKLHRLKDCVVIVGNLTIWTLERAKRSHFVNVSFPNLREITDHLTMYRVGGLYSLGELFPNLARIRGDRLFYDYALIVHDLINLREVGLYSLIRIDRGGVVVWGGEQTCYVSTVRWRSLAPHARVVLSRSAAHCPNKCTCSSDPSWNTCWNNKKCQRFVEGPEAEKCHPECLGCRGTAPHECAVCRHFTHQRACVSRCPTNTLVLQSNQYCLTTAECSSMGGWAWDGSCVFDCPVDYVPRNDSGAVTCSHCPNCQKTCGDLTLRSLDAVQAAEKCVFVHGYLTIHIRAVPNVLDELRTYLRNIQEVSDYIMVYSSIAVTSLDFLSSLRRIGGENLYGDKYSLVLHDMTTMQTLFPENVTKNLVVGDGTLRVYNNPVLCTQEIDKLMPRFPVRAGEMDVPDGMNGFNAGCTEVSIGLQVQVLNETAALVKFAALPDLDTYYNVLYLRLKPNDNVTVMPETCSDSEWFSVSVNVKFGQNGLLQLNNLRPASTYAVCVETYNIFHRNLSRTNIKYFTTAVGKPEPPFILELVASSSTRVVVRWVDHRDYKHYITRYELDVSLIEIDAKDIFVRNHCKDDPDDDDNRDPHRHAVVMRPPPQYQRGCESMCGILSSVTKGAMVEENFDVCNALPSCDSDEADPPANSTFGGYIRSLYLTINRNNSDFEVGGLAPFRDYRFRLRACSQELCSRSARAVVRTQRSEYADMPVLTKASVNNLGFVSVAWQSAELTNGPILSYAVHVMPHVNRSNIGENMPQTYCILSNETETVVKVGIFEKYLVRVCSTSLADSDVCGEWRRIEVEIEVVYKNWWWMGIVFGILIYSVSFLVGFLHKPSINHSDDIPLIDYTSMYRNESDPVVPLSDFSPLYLVHLRDPD